MTNDFLCIYFIADEEIDVVSVSDKKLPTNPSDRDRRAIEHKVGYRFSTARIVKNPNGIRTIPPRRHGSYTLPCSPANSSPMKSVATSRYTSPSATPYHTATYANKYMQKQGNILNADNRINAGVKSRKRPTVHGGSVSAHGADATRDLDYTFPPSKRNRGKKSSSSKHVGHHSELHNASDGDAMSRHLSLDENADTIEKRNLHNNMERQRRISLKKLFDELKVQIPNIMNKDRAPKVNILREATKLCESLTRENQHLCNMKDLLKEQMRKRQEHLARLRSLMRDW